MDFCRNLWDFDKSPFGMLKVKGKIDDYEFSNTHLMPIGNGHLGLAVKSEIRKKIKKKIKKKLLTQYMSLFLKIKHH